MQDHLLSLRRLCLQGRDIAFSQAFLSWRREGHAASWRGTVRGEGLEELGFDEDEVALEGETLDGRSVTGRARVLRLESSWAALQIEGLGPLVVQGRAL